MTDIAKIRIEHASPDEIQEAFDRSGAARVTFGGRDLGVYRVVNIAVENGSASLKLVRVND